MIGACRTDRGQRERLRQASLLKQGRSWEDTMKRTLMSAVALAFLVTWAQPATAQDLASQLVGVWKYTGVTTTEVASGKINKPLGDKPNGYLIYTKGGRLLFSVVGGDRPKPAGAAVSDAEAVPLFRTLAAASGTYKVEGSVITSTYDSSWNQLWTGTSGKRKIEIVGNKMTLTADPVKSDASGLEIVIQTTFERVE
jgi:lipocalin-like protein